MVLFRNPPSKGPGRAGLYQAVGGHVEAGETFLCAAQRELKEELEVSAPITDFVATLRSYKPESGAFGTFYHIYRTVSDEPLAPDPAEVVDARDFAPSELKAMLRDDPALFVPIVRTALTLMGF
jgi:8-oxo-dGTP pyrophosphatase MutT (NUDIX family)